MARFLSDEWLATFATAVATDAALAEACADVDLVVAQEILGGPDGDVAYHVVLRAGERAVRSGPADAPTVTFTQSYDTALAVARGDLAAEEAFIAGQIILEGDVGALVEHRPVFDALGESLRRVAPSPA